MDDLTFVRQIQQLGPFVRNSVGLVFAFSHAHLQYFLKDDATRQLEDDLLRLQGITTGPLLEFVRRSVLFSNGAVHVRRRTPLARTFAFPLMAALRPVIREEAEALIRPRLGKEVDFLDEIAGPFPARIIARILGLPEADIPEFTQAVYSAVRGISITKPDVMAEATDGMTALMRYVEDLLAARRAKPEDDFLSDYISRTDASDLDEREVRAQIATLILAGSDTTRAALTATLSRLLQSPDQWEILTANPDTLAAGAVEEGLRMEPVIGSYARVLTRPLAMEGYSLEEGAIVAPISLTALRDPKIYEAPDHFNITRTDHPRLHPIFGAGPHRCLGEALARVELEEALAVIAREAPNARLVSPPAELRGLGAVRRILGMRTALNI